MTTESIPIETTDELTENDGPAEPEMDASDYWQAIDDRLRYAIGALSVIEDDGSIERVIGNALAGVQAHLREADENLAALWGAIPHPARPRDLTNSYQREDEKRDLVRRMLKLSHDEANEVTFCHIFISSADDPAEGLRLLDKYPLGYVHRFMSVQKDEAEARESVEGGAA